MKTKTKALVLALCAVLLVVSTVFVTMAFLTSTTEVVKNTFTVGDVNITLDEAIVDEYGNPGKIINGEFSKVEKIDDAGRRTENEYKLIPGHSYVKDPTVTVTKTSEQCFVRALVSVSESDMKKLTTAFTDDNANGVFLLQNFVGGWDNNVWAYVSCVQNNGNFVYEFRYVGSKSTDGIVDARTEAVKLEPLFATVEMPDDIDNDTLAGLKDLKINVVAHAIQSDGFKSAAEVWGAWKN